MKNICNKCGIILTNDNWYKFNKLAHVYACKECHRKRINDYRHDTCRNESYTKNKSCSQFLGIHVAERVLKFVFKNVNEMPMHNQGFDFICGKGFKVDIKASCVSHNQYRFKTKRNTIPDYFLFIAFDNRKNLNPKHVWLMPVDFINNRYETSITLTRLQKWLEYELDIDNVINSYNLLKIGGDQYDTQT